jgi:hypothetical protein
MAGPGRVTRLTLPEVHPNGPDRDESRGGIVSA